MSASIDDLKNVLDKIAEQGARAANNTEEARQEKDEKDQQKQQGKGEQEVKKGKEDYFSGLSNLSTSLIPDLKSAFEPLKKWFSEITKAGEGLVKWAGGGKEAQAALQGVSGGVEGGEAVAGGTEAASGGAEALGAEALGALGVVGGVVAGIAIVGVALALLPGLLKGFAEGMLNADKALADFSPQMAQVFAKKEVYETTRNINLGEQRAESTGKLEEAFENLQDVFDDLITPIWNFLQDTLAGILNFITDFLKYCVGFFNDSIVPFFNSCIDALNKIIYYTSLTVAGDHVIKLHLSKIELNTRKKDTGVNMFGDTIRDWARIGNQLRRNL